MIYLNKLHPIADLLLKAARSKATVPYRMVFDLFAGEDVAMHDVHDTLEAACRALAPYDAAIFSAMMTCKDTNLPGSNFFDAFRSVRPDEYLEIGTDLVGYLTEEEKIAITYQERQRIYRYVTEQFKTTAPVA